MTLWASKEVAHAESLLLGLAFLNDREYVARVRDLERAHPALRILNCWIDGVRRETDFRLLVKGLP